MFSRTAKRLKNSFGVAPLIRDGYMFCVDSLRMRATERKVNIYIYIYICIDYIYRRLGGESNREIVSFRVVRACVRARGAGSKVGSGQKSESGGFPFSLLARWLFPFPLLV